MRSLISYTILCLACLALASCAGLQGQSQEESLADLAYPELAGAAQLTPAQHEQVGDRYAAKGDTQKAFLHYTQARELLSEDDPQQLTLSTKTGLLLLERGLDEQALGMFQKVLAADPNHGLANEAAGAVYLRAGLLDEARAHLQKALENDPYLWKAHHYLGVLYSGQNRFDLAVEEFKSSLALASGQAETLNNLGVAHLARAEYPQALDAFHKALKAGAPKEKTYNNIGLALARMGRDQEALEAFRYAGDEAKAYNNLGYVLLLMGDSDRAVVCFEKAIELSPQYYAKAFENLKQARLSQSFRQAGLDKAPLPANTPPTSGNPALPEELLLDPGHPSEVQPAAFIAPQPKMEPVTMDLPPDEITPEATISEAEAPKAMAPETATYMAPTSGLVLTAAHNAVGPDQNALGLDAQSAALDLDAPEVSDMVAARAPADSAPDTTPEMAPDTTLETGPEPLRTDSPVVEAPAFSGPAFALHLSSFKDLAVAQDEAWRFQEQGLDAHVVRVDLDGKGVWYRVVFGEYESKSAARAERGDLCARLGVERLPIVELENRLDVPPDGREPVL